VSTPRAERSVDVQVEGAKLKLGEGEWSGGGELHLQGGNLSGNGYGSTRNIDLERLPEIVDAAAGKIHGTLEVLSYTVKFAGRTRDELRSSLSGSGRVSVANGRLAGVDLRAALERVFVPPRPEQGEEAGTRFRKLSADWRVGQERLSFSNIVYEGARLRFTGKGAIEFDRTVHFELDAYARDLGPAVRNWARRRGGADTRVRLVVTGTPGSLEIRR
jgi:hypothetical protein